MGSSGRRWRRGEAAALLEEQQPTLAEVTPEEVAAALGGLVPSVDVDCLTGELAETLATEFRRGVGTSVDGWLDDDLAFVRDWGFELSDIAVPTYVWQGSEDLMVPFAHGQWLAEHLPGVVAHLEDGEGHLSIGVGATERMSDEAVASPNGRARRPRLVADVIRLIHMTPEAPVDDELRLRAFAGDADVDLAWPWYRDPETVALVDGPGSPTYARDRVAAMYEALSAQGEVYLIERRTPGGVWEAVGDVTLAPDTVPIVVAPAWRGQGIGRRVLLRLVDRAGAGLGRFARARGDAGEQGVASPVRQARFRAGDAGPPAYVLPLAPLGGRPRL
jgi:GNAT superfamily N-acetyltransferase